MPDLLLELFSEEIPARMQVQAIADLQKLLYEKLDKQSLLPPSFSFIPFATPRRLAVIIPGLPTAQTDISTELKGPKIGAPQAALDGFLKKTRLSMEQLEQRDGVYFANIHQKGKATAEVLKTIIEEILASFPWPKSMRWGNGDPTWVRPLHSILCIFDGKVVPVEFAGVKAGNITRGHRFLSPEAITITQPADYESALEKAHVIADREKRKAEILKQAESLAAGKNLALRKDDALLEEVTGLVEWPVMLMGTIDEKFMDLPPEVLTTVMRSHQKYFALQNPSLPSPPNGEGILSSHFLIAANMKAWDGGKAIVAGNERVLRARFSDARFFWDQDRKRPLSEWAEGLSAVTFHAKLGTVADKVERIVSISEQLAEYLPGADKSLVERAARLCKADLVTGMVGEFAELQGIMGRYYALAQGEDQAVADAIRDHYRPQGPGDSVPAQPIAVFVALADKLDTLISMFAVGEKPTGSKDPFALRRAALGVIRIILDNNIRVALKTLFAFAPMHEIAAHKARDILAKNTQADLQKPHKVGKYLVINETSHSDIAEDAMQNLSKSLLNFFYDRLIVQLKDSGIRHDVIKAVIANGDDDLVRIVARAKAVQDFLGTDDGKNLLAGYKRAANIVGIEEKKDKTTYHQEVTTASLKEPQEKELATLLNSTDHELYTLRQQEKFVEAMKLLAKLRQPVDRFFDSIMVNADDKELRANRLRLLSFMQDSMDSIANFAQVEG